jgi:hypothetical protein
MSLLIGAILQHLPRLLKSAGYKFIAFKSIGVICERSPEIMSDHERAAATQHHREPPVSTTLKISSPTCSIDGEPPFTVTNEQECTTSNPIWVFIRPFTDVGNGLEIRDPQRKHRRIGARSTMIADEWDEEALDLNDTEGAAGK